jgi:hypothetical protein
VSPRWTRLSCRAFRDNAVRLQPFALAHNLANFLRSLVLPNEVAQWSLTTLRREKLVQIGARIVRRIGRLRGSPVPATWRSERREGCSRRESYGPKPAGRRQN